VVEPGRKAIALIGFMGAGKSAAGRVLAESLGEPLADADEAIERTAGQRVAEIFAAEGEAGFRDLEERTVLELLDAGGIVALGGGAVESERVRAALRDHVAVWCDADLEVAWERVSRNEKRPLARDRDEFERRLGQRRPLYEAAARAVLPSMARRAAASAAPWLSALRRAPDVRLAWAESASGEYPAAVGPGAAELLRTVDDGAGLPARWFAVADSAVLADHADLLPDTETTIETSGGEQSKTIAEAERVLRELADAGARRDDGVLALGGGVVGDLAGFCAATYQRGIPVAHLPTTLVAQVDSAYGGKTGVDLPEAKNYVGAYHQPVAVLADTRALTTLPAEEMAAGYAEVLKTALIAGGPLWDRVRALENLSGVDLDDVVFACARTKLRVVAADERDAGQRAVLNLGHTVGHAIEAATGYARYRHGEAVGLGLLAALRLSGATELRDEVAGLLAAQDLPVGLDAEVDVDAILAAVERDKKRTAEGVGFVLLEHPGEPLVGQRVDPDSVRDAVEELRRTQAR
jgi:shikimate kinase / 3-dehydroquinate synthase